MKLFWSNAGVSHFFVNISYVRNWSRGNYKAADEQHQNYASTPTDTAVSGCSTQ